MSEPEQLSLGFEPEPPGPGVTPAPEPPAPGVADDDTGADPASEPAPFPPTAEQAAAIDSRDRDIFLEAGAGSGKTRVLVDRYCDAIDLDGVGPESILAFTFTEKAAAEMRRRVRVELARRARGATGEREERLLAASRGGETNLITTIHGFCRRLLGAHPVAAGLDPGFRVLAEQESSRLASLAYSEALEELAGGEPAVARLAAGNVFGLGKMIRAAHQDLRNHGMLAPELPPLQISAFDKTDLPPDPDELEEAAESYEALRRLLAAFARRYAELKSRRSGVDFDDLQLFALDLLRRSDRVRALYRERFTHLLVDEFQDTSPLQVGLITALRGPATHLFTVGDEFQSIYAFRGADLDSFRGERDRAPDDSVLQLTGSFRSTPQIVAAVNALGETLLEGFRPLRVGKPPPDEIAGPDGPTVELMIVGARGWKELEPPIETTATEVPPGRVAEARILAHRLRELADGGVDPGSMVLLLRAFTNVDAYAEALEKAGLDPYVVGGRGYWSAQQVEDALRLLSCVANPLDDEALFGALASPACAASPDALWMLRQAAGRGRHVWPAIASQLLGREGAQGGEFDAEETAEQAEARERAELWTGRLAEDDRERIAGFATTLSGLRSDAPSLPLDALVERTLERFGYDLVALALPRGTQRAANLIKLIRIAGEFESHEGRDLRAFLDYVAERSGLTDREAEAAIVSEAHPGVTVMTIHAAKGLEFDCVAVGELGRKHTGGSRSDLRLEFDGGDAAPDTGHGDEIESPSAVGLRLARAGAGTLTLDGFSEITDRASAAECEETGRLIYVAASRARERLLLAGTYEARELAKGPDDALPFSATTIGRLLARWPITAGEESVIELPAAEARPDLDPAPQPEPGLVRTSFHEPTVELAAELSRDLAASPAEVADAPGGRPPMLALERRPGSAARTLSYVALAEYERCGYRFLVERVLGVGGRVTAGTPAGPGPEPADPATVDSGGGAGDETPPDPGPGQASEDPLPEQRLLDAQRHRLGFGRAVHVLLEDAARSGWQLPSPERAAEALGREGANPEAASRAIELIAGWTGSELLATLISEGARFRPEVPFRISTESGTVLRGTIDLLVERDGEPPLVIDYKTDARAPRPGEDLGPGYLIQRDLYAHAVASALGCERAESLYFFLTAPGQSVRTELGGDEIRAGAARIEAQAAAIAAQDYRVAENPNRALCHDCPARANLCSYSWEETGAPA